MVSGAAGSIGSEICRLLRNYPLKALILIDQAETPLNSLYLELNSNNPHEINISTELLSIRETWRIDQIFKYHQPDYVFHAAAYKHVPLLETFPSEVVLTNIKGTINMADSAAKYGVKKFIMISTDKAVNPTNLMGACKRISELYVHGKNSNTSTQFITTRFGNVMGSQGSVVPLFREQIAKGGPVTITHPDITRYFMTIPEASNLVIEAGIMGSGGETFVFDMGEPVRILDLAKRMIVLAGLKPGKDIDIECIGLRPGEKMYEELFHSKEKQQKTHHPKILKSEPIEMLTLDPVLLERLIQAAENHEMQSVKLLIPKLIPEYDQKIPQKDQIEDVKETFDLSMMNSENINKIRI
jgi:nucleoside-diphosphate-sugar epimerase